jgi:hypothetical protein
MSRKRFSRKGLEKLESNFQIVEALVETVSKQIKKLETELVDLKNHQMLIEREQKENKTVQDFYNQRKFICSRDIARLETRLEVAHAERIGVGLCFRRCYYLMYGKPKMSDIK